jgi:fructosamine-3-kinase
MGLELDTQLTLSLPEASELLSLGFGRPVAASRVEPAAGGMINSVFRLRFDQRPQRAILKVSRQAPNPGFAREEKMLRFLRAETEFPVPVPLFLLNEAEKYPLSALALEELPGVPLGGVLLSAEDRRRLDEQLAGHLIRLHEHTRESFGDIFGEKTAARWLDIFAPRLAEMVTTCRGRTEERTVAIGERLLERGEELFGGRPGPARLVHGDLWANNILVSRDDEGRMTLSGFIDPGAQYADPEYELAYLEVFRTAGERFFEIYTSVFPLDEGYPLRRAVYHLHTMLIHIWLFGDAPYHQRAAAIARGLSGELGLGG